MKKPVLFVALATVFVLSFVSCSGGKSEDTPAEKSNVEGSVQEPGDLGNSGNVPPQQ